MVLPTLVCFSVELSFQQSMYAERVRATLSNSNCGSLRESAWLPASRFFKIFAKEIPNVLASLSWGSAVV